MKKVLTYIVFPLAILALLWFVVQSVSEPVKFNKERDARQQEAITILKDIRTLQVAYKNVHNQYAPAMDSLIDFYNNGNMTIVKQIGSMDDSLAVAMKLVKRENILIPVKDTLFNDRPNFNPENLRYIPYSGGDTVIMKSVVKMVSGVPVPLFEADIPFDSLLKGMDHQLIVNLNYERTSTGRFPGLQVGSIENPNNNAGNWE
ncbi:MAG: hypothetical protein IJS02_04015 [Bacteroidales bacterium]|nr:hypothetical protein [Bacteroidales bacterium]